MALLDPNNTIDIDSAGRLIPEVGDKIPFVDVSESNIKYMDAADLNTFIGDSDAFDGVFNDISALQNALNTLNNTTLPDLQQELTDLNIHLNSINFDDLEGTLAAEHIIGRIITGDKILANTITANEISADTITANEIAADTITANNIMAGAITASKLAIGSFNNLVSNSRFPGGLEDPWEEYAVSFDVKAASFSSFGGTSIPSAYIGQLESDGAKALYNNYIDVSAISNLYVQYRSISSFSGVYRNFILYFYDKDYNTLNSDTVNENEVFSSPNAWVADSYVVPVPADAVYMRIIILYDDKSSILTATEQNTMVMEFTDVKVMSQMSGTLIEDGAITTDKITAGAITADLIEAGAITADKIDAGAITADKIDVAELFSQTINVSGSITIGDIKLDGDGLKGTFNSTLASDQVSIKAIDLDEVLDDITMIQLYYNGSYSIVDIGKGVTGNPVNMVNIDVKDGFYVSNSGGQAVLTFNDIGNDPQLTLGLHHDKTNLMSADLRWINVTVGDPGVTGRLYLDGSVLKVSGY